MSGSLPTGLQLAANGLVSGTATSAADYSFEVEVSDSTVPTPETSTATVGLDVHLAAIGAEESPNWSGYAVGTGPFTAVQGTFTVPSLYSGDAVGEYLSEWVGIDGFGNSSLIQAGIQESIDPANPAMFYIQPWWEILPAPETNIDNGMQIAPDDEITIAISQTDAGSWSISLTDDTTGASFTTLQNYSGELASAEWIVEAPEVGGAISVLAPYTTTEFTNLGIVGAESQLAQIAMVQNGIQVSTPSETLAATGFSVAYGSQAPPSP
jgi:hypothetical protein